MGGEQAPGSAITAGSEQRMRREHCPAASSLPLAPSPCAGLPAIPHPAQPRTSPSWTHRSDNGNWELVASGPDAAPAPSLCGAAWGLLLGMGVGAEPAAWTQKATAELP